MISTRIARYNVSVTKETTATDVLYGISGDDASAFHTELTVLNATPEELSEGKFIIAKSHLTDAFLDMPYLQGVERQLAKATSEQTTPTAKGGQPAPT